MNHIDNSLARLARKQTPWKQEICAYLKAASEKLTKYYSQTATTPALDQHYAFAWLLNPTIKNQAFIGENWNVGKRQTSWRTRYIIALRDKWQLSYQQYTRRSDKHDQSSAAPAVQMLRSAVLAKSTAKQNTAVKSSAGSDELQRYLDTCMLTSTD
jgi:hypothetical protein